jgi:hypothetical protein
MLSMNESFSCLLNSFTQVHAHCVPGEGFKTVRQRIKAAFRWIVFEADDDQSSIWVQGNQHV